MTGGPLQDNVGAPHLNGPPPNSRSGPRFPCAILHLFHTCSSLLELFLFQDRVCFLHIPSHKTAPFHPSAVLRSFWECAVLRQRACVNLSLRSHLCWDLGRTSQKHGRCTPRRGAAGTTNSHRRPTDSHRSRVQGGGTGSRPCVLKPAVPLLVPAEHASLVPHQMWLEAAHPVSSSTGGSGALTDFLQNLTLRTFYQKCKACCF